MKQRVNLHTIFQPDYHPKWISYWVRDWVYKFCDEYKIMRDAAREYLCHSQETAKAFVDYLVDNGAPVSFYALPMATYSSNNFQIASIGFTYDDSDPTWIQIQLINSTTNN